MYNEHAYRLGLEKREGIYSDPLFLASCTFLYDLLFKASAVYQLVTCIKWHLFYVCICFRWPILPAAQGGRVYQGSEWLEFLGRFLEEVKA